MEWLLIFLQHKDQHLTIKLTAFKQKTLILNNFNFCLKLLTEFKWDLCVGHIQSLSEIYFSKKKKVLYKNKYNHRAHAIVIKNLFGKVHPD